MTHCGHPETGFVRSSGGTSYCPACADEYETRLTPGFDAGIEVGGTTHRPQWSWTQPICRECWNERNPDRQVTNAATLYLSEREFCCHCGEPATSGIYVRVDPALIAYPSLKKEDR
jgi:hypothetical protein